ncbi:MAG: hypothetical protein MJE66_07455 [Proteobacteria bacterium]|nr:hypothetical protein [Pseudomonadota bacterium]
MDSVAHETRSPAADRLAARWGSWLLGGFGAVFLAVGLAVGIPGLLAVAAGRSDDEWVQALMGTLFAAVGLAIVLAARAGSRRLAYRIRQRERHPDEPWRWREDWESGRIEGTGSTALIATWLFTLVWNGISLPLLWVVPRELLKDGLGPVAFGALFPLVGALLIVWAIRATLAHRRFGTAEFRLDSRPGVIGGQLRGSLFVPGDLSTAEHVELRLSCINQVTRGHGKNRRTREHIRWQEEQSLAAAAVASSPGMGTRIPVSFPIPPQCEPCREEPSDNRIVWRLEAKASLPGVDFETQFEVPVFRTRDSADEWDAPDPFSFRDGAAEPLAPEEREIPIETSPSGGCELLFRAGRQPAVALVTVIFGTVFVGAGLAVAQSASWGMGLLFGFVFGVVGLIVAYLGVQMAFETVRVHVHRGGLRVERRLLGTRRVEEWAVDRVESIGFKIGLQSGNRVYYDLVARLRDGRPRTLGTRVASKREIEALASRVATELDVPMSGATRQRRRPAPD